jgi:hypothetical protein
MEAPGLAEVERAKRDGRWERAYDGARSSNVWRVVRDGDRRLRVEYAVNGEEAAMVRETCVHGASLAI